MVGFKRGKKAADEKQFAEYAALCGITVNEHGVFFAKQTVDLKANKYIYKLCRLSEDKQARELCELSGGSFWASSQGIIYADKQGKKPTEQKLPSTKLNIWHYDAKLPQKLCELDYAVTSCEFISPQAFYFTASVNSHVEQVLNQCSGNRAKAEKLLAGESDYDVVTELPMWFNGRGFVSGVRNRLFFWNDGTIIPLSAPNVSVDDIALSPDGSHLAYTQTAYDTLRPIWQQLMLLNVRTNEVQELFPVKRGVYMGMCFAPTNTLLAFASDNTRYGGVQSPSLYAYDISDKSWRIVEDSNTHCYYNSLNCDVKTSGSTPNLYSDGAYLYSLDTIDEKSCIIKLSLKDGSFSEIGPDRAMTNEFTMSDGAFFCVAYTEQNAAEIYKLSPEGVLTQLSEINKSACERCPAQKPLPVSFKNENGDEIRGFVLPSMKPVASRPTVLSIHGGPRTAFGTNLIHEMQFLAARGYTVIFCNPTGSEGRGDRFADIRGKYGTVDYRDIIEFCRVATKKYDCVNLDNIGVIGGSYGGYMVNHIIGSTDMFKAAVSQRSISSWLSFNCMSDIGNSFGTDQTGATPWTDAKVLWDASPLRNADKVKTPTLFIHSTQDYRCPMAEGISMYSALVQHSVPTRLCMFKGENHELSRSGAPLHRIRRLTEIADWLDKYLD